MSFFDREPAVFCPPLYFGIALAIGFYPAFIPLIIVLLAAACAAAPAIVLGDCSRRLKSPALRLHALLWGAVAGGLALGLCLRLGEAGRTPAWAASAGSRASASYASDASAQLSAAVLPAVCPRLERLEICGLRGHLKADSSPASGAYRSYPVEVEAFKVRARGISGEYSSSGPLTLLAAGGEALEAGAPVDTGGRLSLPEQNGSAVPAGKSRAAAGRNRSSASGPGLRAAFFASRGLIAGDGRLPAGPEAPRGSMPRDLRGLRAQIRQAFRAALRRAGGREAGGLLEALLMGCRDDLDLNDAASFKNAGCAHILALSGQHLAILAAAVSFLLKPLLGDRKARLGALVLALFFIFIAGPGPSLLRAVLMYALSALAFFGDRPQNSLNILSLAFIITTVFDPESSRSLSYALSYLALFGLVALGPPFERLLASWLPPKLAAGLAASLAAQAATGPLSALVFGSLHPAGIIAALVSSPIVAAFIWWGLGAGIAAGLFPGAGPLLSIVSTFIYRLLSGTMAFFARWPALELPENARMPAALLVVLFAGFVYALPYVEHSALKSREARAENSPDLRGSGGRAASAL